MKTAEEPFVAMMLLYTEVAGTKMNLTAAKKVFKESLLVNWAVTTVTAEKELAADEKSKEHMVVVKRGDGKSNRVWMTKVLTLLKVEMALKCVNVAEKLSMSIVEKSVEVKLGWRRHRSGK